MNFGFDVRVINAILLLFNDIINLQITHIYICIVDAI